MEAVGSKSEKFSLPCLGVMQKTHYNSWKGQMLSVFTYIKWVSVIIIFFISELNDIIFKSVLSFLQINGKFYAYKVKKNIFYCS